LPLVTQPKKLQTNIIIIIFAAASEFGVSSQFNPSKLFIDMLAAVGLVWGRKRGTAAWDMGRVRRDRDREAGVPLPKPAPRPWENKKNAVVKESAVSSKQD
jgi:hypothetical protein